MNQPKRQSFATDPAARDCWSKVPRAPANEVKERPRRHPVECIYGYSGMTANEVKIVLAYWDGHEQLDAATVFKVLMKGMQSK